MFIVGTAGSGKTALTHSFQDWLKGRDVDAISVNLDPGVDLLPYSPEIDVREWISIDEIKEKYGVGPNGAQILAADLLAVKFREIKEALDGYKSQYVLIDTPGQVELFAYRHSSRVVLESLGMDRSMIVYLFDPVLSSTPSGFVSLLLLSASIQFRFPTPFLNALSKADLLGEEKLSRSIEWSTDLPKLYDALLSTKDSMQKEVNIEFFRALENIGLISVLHPVSSKTFLGMEEIYNDIQQSFFGGEDIESA